MVIPNKFTLKVERGEAGLCYVTSPEIKGLLVAERNMFDTLLAVPKALAAWWWPMRTDVVARAPATRRNGPMTPDERAREFVEVGFRGLGVPSLEPYIKIISELIEGAENDLVERCGRIADELAEHHRKDGKPDMALGLQMAAEAIRLFAKPPRITYADESKG